MSTPVPAVRVVLQARLNSARLPGKALLEVAARPMVVLAAQRAANCGHDVVVATSVEPEDDAIVRAVGAHDVGVHRGSLNDPLMRFVTATADLRPDDIVVRLTGDNVFPDGDLVGLLVSALCEHRLSYACVGGNDLPYGLSAEAFTCRALRDSSNATSQPHDRHHVTPWMRRTHGENLVAIPDLDPAWRGARCTVDTFEDFLRVERVVAGLAEPLQAGWRELCAELVAGAAAARDLAPSRARNPLAQSAVIGGTAQLGLAYGAAATRAAAPTPEEADLVLRAMATAGISHVDTARAYGASEERIGFALTRHPTQNLRVVTKVAPLDGLPDGANPRWCRAEVEASVNRSLVALRTSQVDAVLTHRVADWRREGVVATLQDHQRAGTCKVIGASVQAPGELMEVLADARCGYVQMPFNVLDHRWIAPEIEEALRSRPDVTVTCRSVYLQGLLTSASARWPPNVEADPGEIRRQIASLVDELGRESTADLCLAYVLGHDWVTSAIIGLQSPEEATQAARLARLPPLDADEVRHVRARFGAAPVSLLDPARWEMA